MKRLAKTRKYYRLLQQSECGEQFWRKLDAIAMTDATLAKRSKRIARLQRDLRRKVGGDVWQIYLEIESENNARLASLLELLANHRSVRRKA